MKIVCLSDTHNHHKKIIVPDGDVVIHAGDFSSRGYTHELVNFTNWYGKLRHKYKILVAGNHDMGTEAHTSFSQMCEDNGIIYLNDSGTEIEGLNFWGSPVTPRFGIGWAWNRDVADTRSPSEISNYVPFRSIKPHWDMIPEDTDVLITHGPPLGILDFAIYPQNNVGCPLLLDRVNELGLKLHVFGHIHEGAGQTVIDNTIYVNAAICNLGYKPDNPAITVDFND